jgi:hypothetical protein
LKPEYLVRLYSSSKDVAACALVAGPDGTAPNPQCGIVRNHMCVAAPEILKTLVAIGRRHDALREKQMFLSDFGCSAGLIGEALP